MRLVTSAVMATLALTLSACGGDDPPPPEPTTTETTPANPDATLPPMPEVAKEFTPNGAATFVAHYVSVMDYASKTGDTNELGRLSDPDCEGCNRYIDLFRELYERGGSAEGRNWSRSATNLEFQRQREFESFATTTLRISAGTIQESSEATPASYSEVNETVTFGILFDGDWRITQFVAGDGE